MKRDKIYIYIFELLLLVILLFALFMPNMFNRMSLALFLLGYTLIVRMLVKKKKTTSVHQNTVTTMMILFGIIYLALFYIMGIFVGFYPSVTKFRIANIIKYIIPTAIIVVTSEVLRSRFIAQEKVKYSTFLITISTILMDLIVYINIYIYSINSRETFAGIVGYSFFASISCNLLYNYISSRYGNKGIIGYRLLTVLYPYVFPYIPDVYVFFRSVFRIIYPYAIYLVIDYTYKRKNKALEHIDNKRRAISFGVVSVLVTLIVMLISCKFRYGIIVIGSGSMTGALNMGDAVIFESYRTQSIKPGDIIIFNKDDVKFVHRVIKVNVTNGEYRYFTKGDYNSKMDDGYVTNRSILGVVQFRIPVIGYPSIWLRDMFE